MQWGYFFYKFVLTFKEHTKHFFTNLNRHCYNCRNILKWKLVRIGNSEFSYCSMKTLMDAMGLFFCKFVFKFNEHIYDVFNEAFSYWKISHFKNDNYLLQKYFGPSVIVAFKGLPWHLRLWIHVCSQNPLLSIFSCQTKSVSNTNCNIIETQFVANKIPNTRYDSKEKTSVT